MPVALLLAMQAAGMVVDFIGTQQQAALGRLGAKAEQSAIEANIAETTAQSEDQSLQEMRKLRETLGTQAAVFVSRGTFQGAGSAFSIKQSSLRSFSDDERSRRINLLANQANLRTQNIMSGLHQLGSETQLGQSLSKRFFSEIPTTLGSLGSSTPKTNITSATTGSPNRVPVTNLTVR